MKTSKVETPVENYKQKPNLTIPIAIVMSAFIIGAAIIYTNGFKFGGNTTSSPSEGSTPTDTSKYGRYVKLAGKIKFDQDKFLACMDKFSTDEVKKDLSDASSVGANGTPAFFVGRSGNSEIEGVFISGAQPFSVFSIIIDGLTNNDETKVIDSLYPANRPEIDPSTGKPFPIRPTSLAQILVKVSIDDDAVLGNSSAPITMIEFSDYECPFCQRHFRDTHKQLVQNYVDAGKLKIVFRDLPLPFHDPVATEAAVAANCAREQGGDEAYYKYHDEYFSATRANGQGLP